MKEGAHGPLPLFGSLRGDPEGNVWIGESTVFATETPSAYQVVTSDGEWQGSIDLPEGLRVLQIGSDVVLGIETDELDVQAVAVCRIDKEAG